MGGDFGQMTVGLEGDLASDAYDQEYKKQIQVVKELESEGKKVLTMSQFGDWYKANFATTPITYFESEDFLKNGNKIFWYQSPKFRLGVFFDSKSKETRILDLRVYQSDFQEPYYFSPNRQLTLSIYIPSYLDEVNNKDDTWPLRLGEFLSSEKKEDDLFLNFSDGRILLSETGIQIEISDGELPQKLINNPVIKVEKLGKVKKISLNEKYVVGPEGYLFRGFTEGATRIIATKRFLLFTAILFVAISALVYKISFSQLSQKKKEGYLALVIIPTFLIGLWWYLENSTVYYVSQSEVDAMMQLSLLPKGGILIYDKECLGCEWNSLVKPAVFANKRSYVAKLSRKQTVANQEIFETKDRERAKELFDKTKAKYIYLAIYEGYKEEVPFSPGDLGVEKIYSNANAEIWRVK